MSELPLPPATRQLGASGIAVSPIAWGMWRLAENGRSAADAAKLVHAALDAGVGHEGAVHRAHGVGGGCTHHAQCAVELQQQPKDDHRERQEHAGPSVNRVADGDGGHGQAPGDQG